MYGQRVQRANSAPSRVLRSPATVATKSTVGVNEIRQGVVKSTQARNDLLRSSTRSAASSSSQPVVGNRKPMSRSSTSKEHGTPSPVKPAVCRAHSATTSRAQPQAAQRSASFRMTSPRLAYNREEERRAASLRTPLCYESRGIADVILSKKTNPCVGMTARSGGRTSLQSNRGGSPSPSVVTPSVDELAARVARQANSGVGFRMTSPRCLNDDNNKKPLGSKPIQVSPFRTVTRQAVWQSTSPLRTSTGAAPSSHHPARYDAAAAITTSGSAARHILSASPALSRLLDRLTTQHIVATVSNMTPAALEAMVTDMCGPSHCRDDRNIVLQFLRRYFGLRKSLVVSAKNTMVPMVGDQSTATRRLPPLLAQPPAVQRFVTAMSDEAGRKFLSDVVSRCQTSVRMFSESLPPELQSVDVPTDGIAQICRTSLSQYVDRQFFSVEGETVNIVKELLPEVLRRVTSSMLSSIVVPPSTLVE